MSELSGRYTQVSWNDIQMPALWMLFQVTESKLSPFALIYGWDRLGSEDAGSVLFLTDYFWKIKLLPEGVHAIPHPQLTNKVRIYWSV